MIVLTILILLIEGSLQIWVPKILWAYWNKPIQQNSYLNLFVKNHQRYAPGWDIRHINQQSIKQYVKEIPEYDNDLQVFYFNRKAQLADYIRVLLLHHYGGVYIDFTCIFTQNLDWLDEQNLKLNPDILNKYGNQPDYLSFTFPTYGPNKKYYDQESKYQYEISPGYEVWFFATKAKGQFITQMFKYYRKAYLTTKNVDKHDQKDNYLDVILKNEKIEVGALDHYLLINQLQQIVLQRKQRELNKNNNSSKLILAVNYFKLWHLKVETGPFGIGVKLYIRQRYFLLKFSLKSIDRFKLKYKYLLKLTGSERNTLTTYLQPIQTNQKGFKQIITTIKQTNNFDLIDKIFCPQNYWIKEKSAIDTFLLTDDYRKKLLIKKKFSPLETLCLPLKKFLKILFTLNKKYQFLGDQKRFSNILQKQMKNIIDRKERQIDYKQSLIQKQDAPLVNYSSQIEKLSQKLAIYKRNHTQSLLKLREAQLRHKKMTIQLKNAEFYDQIFFYSLTILALAIISIFTFSKWAKIN